MNEMKTLAILVVALVLFVAGCAFGGWLISFFFPVVPFTLGFKIAAMMSLVQTALTLIVKAIS